MCAAGQENSAMFVHLLIGIGVFPQALACLPKIWTLSMGFFSNTVGSDILNPPNLSPACNNSCTRNGIDNFCNTITLGKIFLSLSRMRHGVGVAFAHIDCKVPVLNLLAGHSFLSRDL